MIFFLLFKKELILCSLLGLALTFIFLFSPVQWCKAIWCFTLGCGIWWQGSPTISGMLSVLVWSLSIVFCSWGVANGGLYFRQMNLHIYIGFLHGASIITMERGFYSLKSFFTELQISLLLELLLYSVYFSHFRWIHLVHTSLGRLQLWGRMSLMRRHFSRRGESFIKFCNSFFLISSAIFLTFQYWFGNRSYCLI